MTKPANGIPLVILVTLLLGCSQQQPRSLDLPRIKQEVEANTKPFDPAFFKSKYIALVYKIDSGIVLPLDTGSLRRKKGKFPTHWSPGTFWVSYYDSVNSVIGSYSTHNPLYYQVESGPDQGQHKVIDGSFEVLLPANKSIATVQLKDDNKTVIKSDVRKLIKIF